VSEGQLSVALLLSDLNEVKEICGVFRKLGIIPHFYEDLKTFWSGTLENTPSLCIVDVKMMSEGELTLHEHPSVKSENCPWHSIIHQRLSHYLFLLMIFITMELSKKQNIMRGNYERSKRLNHH